MSTFVLELLPHSSQAMFSYGKSGIALKVDWDAFIMEGNQDVFYTLYSHYYDYLTFGNPKGVMLDKSKDCIMTCSCTSLRTVPGYSIYVIMITTW